MGPLFPSSFAYKNATCHFGNFLHLVNSGLPWAPPFLVSSLALLSTCDGQEGKRKAFDFTGGQEEATEVIMGYSGSSCF
jgi:hypothetical protein